MRRGAKKSFKVCSVSFHVINTCESGKPIKECFINGRPFVVAHGVIKILQQSQYKGKSRCHGVIRSRYSVQLSYTHDEQAACDAFYFHAFPNQSMTACVS